MCGGIILSSISKKIFTFCTLRKYAKPGGCHSDQLPSWLNLLLKFVVSTPDHSLLGLAAGQFSTYGNCGQYFWSKCGRPLLADEASQGALLSTFWGKQFVSANLVAIWEEVLLASAGLSSMLCHICAYIRFGPAMCYASNVPIVYS